MFAAESQDAIQEAFDDASSKQRQLPGGLGIGELETMILTTYVMDYAGNDAFGVVVENLNERLLEKAEAENPFVYMTVNGRRWKLNMYEITQEDLDGGDMNEVTTGWSVNVWMPGTYKILKCHTTENAMHATVQAFAAMQKVLFCSTCGGLLPNDSCVYCSDCLTTWNDKGCKLCGGQVGHLKDGVHEPCAKRQRMN